jgi:hypothetical protein
MIIQSRVRRFLKVVLPVIIFAIILALFVFAVTKIAGRSESEGRQLTEKSIRRAAVQCYALEGMYPLDFDYLKEHYGVKPDEIKYVVYYTYNGANLMPDITVIPADAETPEADEVPPEDGVQDGLPPGEDEPLAGSESA